MKRLLSLIIALFLVTCNFNVLLYAEETVPVSDIVELDINEEGVERAFTYYSYEDNRHYLVKVYDDKIDVLNADTLEVVLSAERRKGPELSLNQNALLSENMGEQISINGIYDGEDAWSDWAYVRQDSLYISDEPSTISEIVGILCGEFAKLTTELAFTIASAVYNNRYQGVYAKIYRKINKYCGILQIEQYRYFYNGTTTSAGEETYGPSWFGNPWDYTQPAACRVLAQTY